MDKELNYQKIVRNVLQNFVQTRQHPTSPIATQLLIDVEHNHFQVLRSGWKDGKQVFNVIFHIEIIDGKIWLQRNMSDYDIIADIEEFDIPKQDIVLGFHSPIMRQHSGYGVASA